MKNDKILILDDEQNICDSLEFALEDDYTVYTTGDPDIALNILNDQDISVVLLDIKIGSHDGLKVLKQIKSMSRETQVIMITAFGSIKSSIKAMKEGAFHYLTKPLDMEELMLYIEKALEYRRLNFSLVNLKNILTDRYDFKEIVGQSQEIKTLTNKMRKIIDIDTTVLILGESGTGKDLIARALHFQGNRKDANFIIVNCAAIPNNLLESELFGYEKGSFTGADRKKVGKIQLAHNGTLFLDEIAEMDMNLQAKILRTVENMEVTPLGSNIPQKVNIRIIAATNKDLEEEVKKGNFREDLYYRLNVIKLDVPPLRERSGDIPILLSYFIDKYNKKFNKRIQGFSKEAIEILNNYAFPGNVRELDNLVEMLVILSDDTLIEEGSIPDKYHINRFEQEEDLIKFKIGTTIYEAEKEMILKTLEYNDGSRKKTSEMLNISERSLLYKLKDYKLN